MALKYYGADLQNPIGITGTSDTSVPNKVELVLSVDGVTKSDPTTTQNVVLTQFVDENTYNSLRQNPVNMSAGVRYVLDETSITGYIPIGRNRDYVVGSEQMLYKQDGTPLLWFNNNAIYEQSFTVTYPLGSSRPITTVGTVSNLSGIVDFIVYRNSGEVVSSYFSVARNVNQIQIIATPAFTFISPPDSWSLYVVVKYTKFNIS